MVRSVPHKRILRYSVVRVRWCCRSQSALATDEEIFHGVMTLAHSLYHGLMIVVHSLVERVQPLLSCVEDYLACN